MVYLYEAGDQISDFYHQQLEKCDEKYLGQTNRGKTVYPPPPSGGYNNEYPWLKTWSKKRHSVFKSDYLQLTTSDQTDDFIGGMHLICIKM